METAIIFGVIIVLLLLYDLVYKIIKAFSENKKLRTRIENDSQFYSKLKDELKKSKSEVDFLKGSINQIEKTNPFDFCSSLKSDLETAIYDDWAEYLRKKSHPAYTSAEILKGMKVKARETEISYRQMLYKYEFLLNTFPELRKYVDDYEAIISLRDNSNYEDFSNNRDVAADYISKEEWIKLPRVERNQLALDRYKKKVKSNWVIGIEYEMYIDYCLRQDNFITIPFGSLYGFSDLGRDIIASKTDSKGDTTIYIIQCKNYSVQKEKLIHENVVCQTFGTAMEYKVKNKNLFLKVIPVIYSTVPLSETAKVFAEKLGVIYREKPKGEYPMIKCNINKNGDKIYHLPFDQQYYKTKICNNGEFYAWTVKEAEAQKFRRAYKYIPH